MVKNPLVLDVAALRAMPVTEFGETPMYCGREEPKYVVESYRGVLLRDILEAAVVDDELRHSRNYMYVVANATDDYKVVFSLHEIRNTPIGDEILVFYEKNGEPLGTAEGLIALVSRADRNRCNRHIRWLNSIEVHRFGMDAD
jgi:DMSO/TMAO reductase YedYZ molybdopterin-dependent catalytic subunit